MQIRRNTKTSGEFNFFYYQIPHDKAFVRDFLIDPSRYYLFYTN